MQSQREKIKFAVNLLKLREKLILSAHKTMVRGVGASSSVPDPVFGQSYSASFPYSR